MALHGESSILESARGVHDDLRVRLALFRLEASPIERKGHEVAQVSEAFGIFFRALFSLALEKSVRERDHVEAVRAEQERVVDLLDRDFLSRGRMTPREDIEGDFERSRGDNVGVGRFIERDETRALSGGLDLHLNSLRSI